MNRKGRVRGDNHWTETFCVTSLHLGRVIVNLQTNDVVNCVDFEFTEILLFGMVMLSCIIKYLSTHTVFHIYCERILHYMFRPIVAIIR